MDEESVFLRALEFETGPERAAFLSDVCGDDRALRARVESLLKHHVAAGNFLEEPPAELQQTFAACFDDTIKCFGSEGWEGFLDPCEKPGRIGQLGPYEIMAVVGSGGMGVVLRALDAKLNREVAIKVMPVGANSSAAAKRIVREARAAAAIKHDHVVTIHAVHDDDPLPYLVMEYVEGISLQQRLDAGEKLEVSEIVRIGAQIAEGLSAAHRCGLIHRDIKPANILLEAGSGRAKITDFGLARAANDAELSREGQIAGTPQFMSPEQAQGLKADHRSDLFSLGNVLYMMCMGRPAFAGESAVATLRGICDHSPRSIRETRNDVPAWLDQIIFRLLEKQPERRVQKAREVADLLGGRVGDLQVPALAPLESVKARSPRRWSMAALAAASVVLACVVIVIVNRNGKSTRIEIPEGASARISSSGQVEIDLPSKPAAPKTTDVRGPDHPLVAAVVARLKELNPGFDGKVTSKVLAGEIVELEINADGIRDLSPLQAVSSLQRLVCAGSERDASSLADLSPLSGMKLQALDCSNTQVADLAPLTGLPLTELNLNGTRVVDLSPLAGMRLERLNCANTKVVELAPLKGMPLVELSLQGTSATDLAPLRGLPLKHLNVSSTSVTDIDPLQGMSLKTFYCDATHIEDLSPLKMMPLTILNWRGYDHANGQHREIVQSIATLEVIDSMPASEFWRDDSAATKN